MIENSYLIIKNETKNNLNNKCSHQKNNPIENFTNNDIGLLSKYRHAIMGFAALWIFVFHLWIITSKNSTSIYFAETFIKRLGFCGVDIFFFLSGFSLIFSIKDCSILLFYYKRIKRIILPFLITAILMSIFNNWTILELCEKISFYSFYTISIYNFLWFIPAIITLYIIFPFYYNIFVKSKNKSLFTMYAILIWLIFSILFRNILRIDLYGFTNRIPVFIIGILFGSIIKNQTIKFNKLCYILLLFILIISLYLGFLINFKKIDIFIPVFNAFFPNVILAPTVSLLLAKFLDIMGQIKLTKYINSIIVKSLSFWGIISLEFYCLQEWIGNIIINNTINKFSPVFINILVFISVSIAAFLLFIINKYFWLFVTFIVSDKKSK